MTDLVAVLAQLKQERDRLNRAIEALSGLVGPYHARGVASVKRTLSAAARKKIADAQRARWAKVKAKGAKKAT